MAGLTRRSIVLPGLAMAGAIAAWLFIASHHTPTQSPAASAAQRTGSATAAPAAEALSSTDDEIDDGLGADAHNMVHADISEKAASDQRVARAKEIVSANIMAVQRKYADAFRKLTPYHVEEAQLKENLRAQYGEITEEKIPRIQEAAKGLLASFWEAKDFDDPANCRYTYEARALLELCLERDPTNEAVLRQVSETITAGWPTIILEGNYANDRDLQWHNIQRDYDHLIPLWTLWKEHLSKRPASSVQDICIAWDLVHRSDHKVTDVEAYKDIFRKTNPNPAPALSEMVEKGVSLEDRLAAARWARDGALAQGGTWYCYSDELGWSVYQLQHGLPLEIKKTLPTRDRTKYSSASEMHRWHGRGMSFIGPPGRVRKPWHEILQEIDPALRADIGRLPPPE